MKKFLTVLAAIVLLASSAEAHDLAFDSSGGVERTLTCNGRAVTFIAYENIFYVAKPVGDLQKLSVYIPAEYLRGETINGYSAKTAPIFLPNGVGGYMPGKILAPVENDRMTGGANASLVALSRGLVVVSPAIRGRTDQIGGARRLSAGFVSIATNFPQATPTKSSATAQARAARYRHF